MDLDQFQRYAEGWPEAMFLLTGDGEILAVNKAAGTFFGVSPAAFSGRRLADLVDDSDKQLDQCLEAWRNSPELFQAVLSWFMADGVAKGCITQGFLLQSESNDAPARIILRASPGTVSPGDFRTLNRQLDTQRKVLSRLRASREALATEHTKALVTLNSISDAVITTDKGANIEWLNPMAELLTGWDSSAAQGRPLQSVFNIIEESSGELVVDSIAECLQTDRVVKLPGHNHLISRDGTEYMVEVSATPLHTESGEVFGAVIIFRDITSAHLDRRQLEYLTQYDLLTGLFNRQYFEQQLEQAVARHRRSGESYAMLYMDLDGFKAINDGWGHHVGDDVLVAAAEFFERRVRGGDVLARLGGDQFGVLLSNVDEKQAVCAAESFRAALDNFSFPPGSQSRPVHASVGIALFDAAVGTTADIMKRAELGCYLAQREGGNRCRLGSGGEPAVAESDARVMESIKR